jgi:hypothetical protein
VDTDPLGLASKNIKNYDFYVADKKDKTMWTGTSVNKSKKNSVFNVCKVRVVCGFRFGSGFGAASKFYFLFSYYY